MPAGETEKSPSAWTIDSLHEHLVDAMHALRDWITDHLHSNERLINEMDRRYQQRFEAQQIAIDKAEKTINDRLEGMNEFRATLEDQSKTFMPRVASDQRYDTMMTAMQKLEDRLNTEVRRIDNRLDTSAGRATGLDKGWGYLVGLAGFVGGIIAVIISLAR